MMYLLIFLTIFSKIYCFNLDINTPIIYYDPLKTSCSYFGYSIALYPGNQRNAPWIMIGAPRGNNLKMRFNNSGVVFKCGIGEKCSVLNVDLEQTKTTGGLYVNKLDGAWIGGSMDINYKYERFVTCGYRWINVKPAKNPKNVDYRMQGACYWSHINDKIQKLIPLLDNGREVYTDAKSGRSVYYYGQGEAGFSAHMPIEENELLLGAPGVFNWEGTTILYKDSEEEDPIASKLSNKTKRYVHNAEFANINIASAIYTSETSYYDLLGYSGSSGHFFNKKKLLYVSGAPRSSRYLGQILVYKFSKSSDMAIDVKDLKRGTQLGEYFGASLTVGDINNDGYDDLIVGSPHFSTLKYNEGRIHVFLGSPEGRLQTPYQDDVIVGSATSGQFGTCVQFLGDLNKDNYGDVAVAAPFEAGGVVYLFRGGKNGLDPLPSQRIVGSDFFEEIRGFGASISRPADVDFNGYSDVAIGAFISGHTVLLRTRPVVVVYHSLKSMVSRLDYREKSFEIEACYWFSLDQPHYNINITRSITVDDYLSRATVQNGKTSINLTQNEVTCEKLTVVLKKTIANHYDPIKVTLSHEMIQPEDIKEVVFVSDNVTGTDYFCPRCPVYDKYRSSLPATLKVSFALGCGNDEICNSRLEIFPKFLDFQDAFILGSSAYVKLAITVKNSGEKAYLTQLVVSLPEVIHFRQIPPFCVEQNVSIISCSVDNPLNENSQKTVVLDLDMKNVNTGKCGDSLKITVTVLTSSENSNENTEEVKIKLKREVDVTVNGRSGEQSYFYGNLTEGKANFSQIYQIEKFGASPIDEVQLEISIPHSIKVDGKTTDIIQLYPPEGFLAGQPISCKSNFNYILEGSEGIKAETADAVLKRTARGISQNVSLAEVENLKILDNRTLFINCSGRGIACSDVVCVGGPFKKRQNIAVIQLKMIFNVSVLKRLMGKKDIIQLSTQGRIQIKRPSNFVQSGKKPDSVTVSSVFLGDIIQNKVESWIILLAVMAGLLLLLLVILGLIKMGFFKRATKEELKALKAEQNEEMNEEEFKAMDSEIAS